MASCGRYGSTTVGKRKTDRSKRNLKIERDAREKTVPVRDDVVPWDDIEEKVDEVHENRDQTCVQEFRSNYSTSLPQVRTVPFRVV
jgi:hypothetical protein